MRSRIPFALLLLAFACRPAVSSNVIRTGPALVARPADCEVQVFGSGQPTYGYADVARVDVRCNRSAIDARDPVAACQARLRADACQAGADTVYNVFQSELGGALRLRATFARRIDAPVVPPVPECRPPCSPGYRCDRGRCLEQCDPACEAGFECVAHQCTAVCNPACQPGFHCAEDRTCQENPVEAQPVVDAGVPDAGPEAAPTGARRARKRQ